jgi:hypothetical protein
MVQYTQRLGRSAVTAGPFCVRLRLSGFGGGHRQARLTAGRNYQELNCLLLTFLPARLLAMKLASVFVSTWVSIGFAM